MDVFDLSAKIMLDSSEYEKALNSAKNGLENLGTKIGVAAQAIYDFGKESVKALMDVAKNVIEVGAAFDTSMANVAAISGASGDALDALREKAKEMGAETKFSASEAADAFTYMAMAGWSAEEMLDGINGVLNLAAASGEDLATTSDIVTDALTAFGLTAADSSEFADVLAAASSNANTNVSMMGETFKYVAPLAGTLGYSVQDMAVAIGLMANSGIKAGQAGTALRASLSSLTKPTEQTKEVMRDLGLIITDTVQVIDDADISAKQDKLASATANLEKKQIAYNEAVSKYGAESSKAQTALINLEEAQRKARKAQEELLLATQGNQETVDLYNAAITDADGNMISFSQTVEVLRKAFSGLSEAEQTSAAAQLFGQEAMSGMLAIINAAPADIEKLTEAVNNASGSAESMAAIMGNNVGGAWDEFTSALEGAQIALYETFSDELQNMILGAADAVSRLTSAFESEGFEGVLREFGTMLSEGVQGIVETVQELTGIDLSGVVQGFKDAFSGIGTAISDTFDSFDIGGVVQDTLDAIAPLATGIGEIFAQIDLSPVMDAFESIRTSVSDTWQNIIDGIDFEAIGEALNSVVNAIDDGAAKIKEAFEKNGLRSAAKEFVGVISDAFRDVGPKILEAASSIISSVGEVIMQIGEYIYQAMPESVQTLIDSIGNFFSALWELLMELWDRLKPFYVFLYDTLLSGLVSVLQTIFAILDGLFGALSGAIDATTAQLKLATALIKGDFQAAADAVKNAWDGVVDFFVGVANAIMSIFTNLASFMADIGRNLWEGLKSGLSNAISGITEIGSDIANGFKDFFGINSPSRLFREYGQYMADGLGLGWNDEIGSVVRKMSDGLVVHGSVDFASSAVGKSSAAAINGMMSSAASGTGGVYSINLIVDGRTLASVVFDPLNNMIKQKGVALGA